MAKKQLNPYNSFFLTLGELEESIEAIREVIYEQKNLSYFHIFRKFNQINRDGFITLQELDLYIKESHIRASNADIEHFYYYFASDQGNGISFM
jgi:hypothetical protein